MRAVMVLAVLARSLALTYHAVNLKGLKTIDKIRWDNNALKEERSIHWGLNLTTVSELLNE